MLVTLGDHLILIQMAENNNLCVVLYVTRIFHMICSIVQKCKTRMHVIQIPTATDSFLLGLLCNGFSFGHIIFCLFTTLMRSNILVLSCIFLIKLQNTNLLILVNLIIFSIIQSSILVQPCGRLILMKTRSSTAPGTQQ